MPKTQRKQAEEWAVTHTKNVNMEVAKEAIFAVFSPRDFLLYDYDPRPESSERFTMNATLHRKKPDVRNPIKGIHVVVLWPEGQNRHGSVEVTFPADLGNIDSHGHATHKFACWKNEDGTVEVAPWYTPPKVYEFQRTHGLKYPRNQNLSTINTKITLLFLPPIVLWVLTTFFAYAVFRGFGFVGTGAGLSMVGILGAVLGMFLGCHMYLEDIEKIAQRAWEEDLNEKKILEKSSTPQVPLERSTRSGVTGTP